MTILSRGLTFLPAETNSRDTSAIRSRRNRVQLFVPLAAMSDSVLLLVKKKSSTMIFIEVARGVFDNLPELLAVLGIGCRRRSRNDFAR